MLAMKYNQVDLNTINENVLMIRNAQDLLKKDFEFFDKRLEKIDTRLWQIIVLLLSYPLGLIVGKICHIF